MLNSFGSVVDSKHTQETHTRGMSTEMKKGNDRAKWSGGLICSSVVC